MTLNLDRTVDAKVFVTHHGLGPTLFEHIYINTRNGDELFATPEIHFRAHFQRFATDGEVRAYGVSLIRNKMERPGDRKSPGPFCHWRGAINFC